MKKFITLVALLFACQLAFATGHPVVEVADGTTGTVVNFPTVTDGRSSVNNIQELQGSFIAYTFQNVSSSATTQLWTGGYAHDLQIKAGATNSTVILIGPNSTTSDTVSYPLASDEVIYLNLASIGEIYFKARNNGGPVHNTLSFTCNLYTP